ncbi:MAG: SH3 domain-containing protein [Verrucomicrobiales bacterium]
MKKFIAASFVFATSFLSIETRAEERAVVTDNRVNIRGQAKLYSEVITQLKAGDEVTILEEISTPDAKAGEPTNWAKIKLPPNTTVWVFAPLIKEGTVSGSRLNLRAGPGENYSVLGRINRGAQVTEIRTVEEWMEIEPPSEAYAFIDRKYLKPVEGGQLASAEDNNASATAENPSTAPATDSENATAAPAETTQKQPSATPEPETTTLEPSTVGSEPPAVARAQDVPATEQDSPAKAAGIAAIPPSSTLPLPRQAPQRSAGAVPDLSLHLPQTAPEPPAQKVEQPRRIVRREGIVKGTFSIQAPTYFELENPTTGKTVNYLHAEKSGLNLKQYKKLRVVITGEEFIDPRWPKTPVIEIETLEPAQ